MKRTHTLALTLTAGLLLTACGGTSTTDAEPNIDPVPAADTPEPAPTEEEAPDQKISERGSQVLEAGETGSIVDLRDDTELLSFTVQSIEVNPQCTGERAEDPENGTFVVFEMEIESDVAAGDHYIEPHLLGNPYMYRVIDEEGITRSESLGTSAAYNCFPESEQTPSDLGPGERGTGKMVLDVPVESGTLIMGLDVGEDLQWEWEF